MFASAIEQNICPEDVGLDELGRTEDRAVDVRLRGEVENRLATLCRCGDGAAVGDVALHELDVRALEVRAVARIGELVEDNDLVACGGEALCAVRADEPGATGDEDSHRPEA